MSAGGDDMVAACQQLADEFKADAAVGASDEAVSDAHAGSLRPTAFTVRHGPASLLRTSQAGLVA
jgi:hypothetical protein